MVGQALERRLADEPVEAILGCSSKELDLRDRDATLSWVKAHRPDVAIIAAGRVGGIEAHRLCGADFRRDNVLIGLSCIDAVRAVGARRAVFVGIGAVYPVDARQPTPEGDLLTGPLDDTHRGYSIAKIAVQELNRLSRTQHGLDAFTVTPINLYGPGDNFDPETSHVVPGLLRRFHEAKVAGADRVAIWGTGRPRRSFLHVDDLADAIVHTTRWYQGGDHINVGPDSDVPIAELAAIMARVVGWSGEIAFDPTRPDGLPRRLLDTRRLQALGWEPAVHLGPGLRATYRWMLDHADQIGLLRSR